jgi:hypothetical protein
MAGLEGFLDSYLAIPTVHTCELFDTKAIRNCGYRLLGKSDVLVAFPDRQRRKRCRRVSQLPQDDPRAYDEWITVTAAGCLGRELVNPEELEIGGIVSRMTSTYLHTGRTQSQAAAGGALFIKDGIGILFCDSTLPEYRRLGLHGELIEARLQQAWDNGCEFVCATIEPGSASARNYLRSGFERVYARLTFQRPLPD